MASSSGSSGLIRPFSGIFPVISYLHVPGKMSKPLWLMLGTCFLLENKQIGWDSKAPFVLLSSAHTFAPWMWMSDAKALKIPEEYRKTRFVVGRVMMHDETLRAIGSQGFSVTLSAMHPTLDVCVLTMQAGVERDAFATEMRRRELESYFELNGLDVMTPDADSATASIQGFRGCGKLGELDTMDASTLSKLSKKEQEALLAELQVVEGKQEGCVSGLRIVRRGVGCITHGGCFNGMSGAPVQASMGSMASSSSSQRLICDGVLYGLAHRGFSRQQPVTSTPAPAPVLPPSPPPAGEEGFVGYIPSAPILQWLRELGSSRK